eukprot:m.178839 g.178839  ORF g.178839 m.178839 type:complete len:316 (+) comp15362_c0_seq1:187-1134(+)
MTTATEEEPLGVFICSGRQCSDGLPARGGKHLGDLDNVGRLVAALDTLAQLKALGLGRGQQRLHEAVARVRGLDVAVRRVRLQHEQRSRDGPHHRKALLGPQRAPVDANVQPQRLAPRHRRLAVVKGVDDAAAEAGTVALEDGEEVVGAVAHVQKERQPGLLGQHQLRLEPPQLDLLRAKVQPVPVQPQLADGHHLVAVGLRHLQQLLQIPLPAMLQLHGPRGVHPHCREQAWILPAQGQGLVDIGQRPGRDDDALHAGLPRALQHLRKVVCVLAGAAVHPVEHRIRQIGPNINEFEPLGEGGSSGSSGHGFGVC